MGARDVAADEARGDRGDDAVARELDRLLRLRDARGARAVREIEYARDVSPEALFGTAWERDAPVNASTMPTRFYACEGSLAMTLESVRAVRDASAAAMARSRARGGETSTSEAEAREEASFDATATALCANGDHATAWNARKRRRFASMRAVSIEDVRDAVSDELAFASAVQSRFPKAPSAWSHRRWVLAFAARRMSAAAAEAEIRQTWFRRECEACDAAVVKKRLNYAAWSHRAWALTLVADDVETVSNEMRENETRAGRNVSDYCVLHYRTRVIERYLVLRPGEISEVFVEETAKARRLIAAHPGREALWSYYRFVFARMIQSTPVLATDSSFLEDTKTFIDTMCDVERTARLDPTWAEHTAATQRRLALAFQTWTHVIISRARGATPVVQHTRITDGEVVSTL